MWTEDVTLDTRRPTSTRSLLAKSAKFLAVATGILVILSVAATLPLRWINPVTTSFILQDHSARSSKMRRAWTPIEDMSRDLPIAVVAAEDQKFPLHHGFDLESLSQAMSESNGRRRGASTITMQLAKNLYLWPGRSVFRKGLEAYFTILLEAFLPKRRILEIYLNVVEFGQGTYGAGAATHLHFRKPVSDIGAGEAALLAAVLPNPKVMNAGRPSAYVRSRAARIAVEVRRLGGHRYLAGL